MPGAGKTTVVETFISEVGMNDKIFNDVRSYHLFLRYNKYTGRLIKFFEFIFALLKNRSFSAQLFFFIIKYRGTNNFVFLLKKYIYISLRYAKINSLKSVKNKKVFIQDEGLIQSIISILFPNDIIKKTIPLNSIVLRKILKQLDVVIFFDLDVNTAIKRINSRNTFSSRFDNLEKDLLNKKLKLFNDYIEKMYNESKINDIRTFKIDGNQSKKFHVQIFTELLNEINHLYN